MLAKYIKNEVVRHVFTAALTAAVFAGVQAAGFTLPDWAKSAVISVVGQ